MIFQLVFAQRNQNATINTEEDSFVFFAKVIGALGVNIFLSVMSNSVSKNSDTQNVGLLKQFNV